jgi:radical SAM protein with 4Fe4S-binding SPASM domain
MTGKKNIIRVNDLEEHIIGDESYQVIDGVASIDKPSVQLFVNKRLLQALGIEENDVTNDDERCLPTIEEVIFSVSDDYYNHNSVDCATDHDERQVAFVGQTPGDFECMVDKLLVMGVNRITFEGDNLLARPGLLENAKYAHNSGIMPSIVTNLHSIDKDVLDNCEMFARISINLDSTSGDYPGKKDKEYFNKMAGMIAELKSKNTEVAFNMVISAENFNRIGDICKFAASVNVRKISLQRIKAPVQEVNLALGHSAKTQGDLSLQPNHLKVLVPVTQRLAKRYEVDFEFDCSLFQALAFHNISVKDALLEWNSYGCGAGRRFINVDSSSVYKGCGSCSDGAGSILDIDSTWHLNEQINSFKNWMKKPAAPCEFCSYLDLCRGGCRVVAKHNTGDFNNPDPACPIIADFRRGIIHAALTS